MSVPVPVPVPVPECQCHHFPRAPVTTCRLARPVPAVHTAQSQMLPAVAVPWWRATLHGAQLRYARPPWSPTQFGTRSPHPFSLVQSSEVQPSPDSKSHQLQSAGSLKAACRPHGSPLLSIFITHFSTVSHKGDPFRPSPKYALRRPSGVHGLKPH
jgi:hypothetical protein